MSRLVIVFSLLLSVAASAEMSKVRLLEKNDPQSHELARKNISKFDSGTERINRCLKVFAATKFFEIEIDGEDFALIVAKSQGQQWPGNNSFLVLLLNSELESVDCVMMGGEQVFATAFFRGDELELVTYSRARGGGIYTQEVQVSATSLLAEEAIYSKHLDLGDCANFTLFPPKTVEQN